MDEGQGPIDPGDVAARLRALVKKDDWGDLVSLARRLRVDERALRANLSTVHPKLDVEVLTAMVHELGIDPNWLLTGRYSSATHHLALDDDRQRATSAVAHFIKTRLWASASQPIRPSPGL